MKFHKGFLLLLIPILSITLMAQTGSLKIFSDIDSINVYLDDVFQGTNAKSFTKVSAGTHYLRIMKNDVKIYGDLVQVRENEVTSILINMTPELQQKLLEKKLAGMTEQINKYKESKLSVYMQYAPSQIVNGVPTGQGNMVIKQGNIIIDDRTLAKLTGDDDFLKQVDNRNRSNLILRLVSAPFCITGIPLYVYSVVKLIQDEPLYPGASTSTGIQVLQIMVCSVPLAVGMALFMSGGDQHHMGFEYASDKANAYNIELKKTLGLPENFEVQ